MVDGEAGGGGPAQLDSGVTAGEADRYRGNSIFVLRWWREGRASTNGPRTISSFAPQPHAFGLSPMFQAFAEQSRPNTVVVKTMEEACECLGLERRPRCPRPTSEGGNAPWISSGIECHLGRFPPRITPHSGENQLDNVTLIRIVAGCFGRRCIFDPAIQNHEEGSR